MNEVINEVKMNAVDTMDKVREYGQNRADDSARTVGSLAVGDHVAQGDVLFWKIDKIPSDAIQSEPISQLTTGSTQGSRHCIKSGDMRNVDFYTLKNPNALQGPILCLNEPTTVEHPEHGNLTFPKGLWFTTYQCSYASELKKIQD